MALASSHPPTARLLFPDYHRLLPSSPLPLPLPFHPPPYRLSFPILSISSSSSPLSKITELEDGRPHPDQLSRPPPWQKSAADASPGDLPNLKPLAFRPAPWHQGSRDHRAQAPPPKKQGAQTRRTDEDVAVDAEAHASALARIVEKLRTIHDTFDASEPAASSNVDETRSPSGVSAAEVTFPWEKPSEPTEQGTIMHGSQRRNLTRADLLIPPHELKRLRMMSPELQERLKIGKLGVTKSIVISIQQQWRTSELVKVRCQGPAANSIKKTLSDIEEKTGGLVIWRDKNTVVVYRGNDFNVEDQTAMAMDMGIEQNGNAAINGNSGGTDDETEMESLLDGLGPRYEKWTGLRPIPIDADLLPPEVPNYKPPFRLLPAGVRPGLSDAELTDLRRLARPLAPHFVLGRNKGQQGLAVAMLKLWEKTEIVKIAVKKRVQNTNNEMMADQIRRLTGGVLLSRDKFFITFYRGKDFVPQNVAAVLTERELLARDLQEEEEKARDERNIPVKRPPSIQPSVAVIRSALPEVAPSWMHTMDIEEQKRLKKEVAKLHQLTLARELEKKLYRALKKKEKAEQDLQKVEAFMKPIEQPADIETITEEERFMYRKLGIRMKSTLLLGKRGVFDGVVENMHLHWKHRELVKLVVHESDPVQLQETARMLEYESGGILVAIVPSSKGHGIIMYRGKNYQRPSELRPRNLLTKQKALKRAIEMQRRASLIQNIQALESEILKIKADLNEMECEMNGIPGDDEETNATLGTESAAVSEKIDLIKPSMTDGYTMYEEKTNHKTFLEKIKKLERHVNLGPIFKAEPLKNSERLKLRKKALSLNKASQFFVGKSNDLEGLARGIRIYFLHHSLAKVVVKGRGQGTSVQELIQNLEILTGGVLVSQENNKIILYRGWPEGFEMPRSLDSISSELRAALDMEEESDGDVGHQIFHNDHGIDNEYMEEDEYTSDIDNAFLEVDETEDDYDMQLDLDRFDENDEDGSDETTEEDQNSGLDIDLELDDGYENELEVHTNWITDDSDGELQSDTLSLESEDELENTMKNNEPW